MKARDQTGRFPWQHKKTRPDMSGLDLSQPRIKPKTVSQRFKVMLERVREQLRKEGN